MKFVVVGALLLALVSCSEEDPQRTSSTAAPTPGPTAPPTAAAVPKPELDVCYDLGFDEALAPTSEADSVPCSRRHTSQTFAIGRLNAVVDGHLLAVDSRQVQEQVASKCPQTIGAYVGGTIEQQRLSMLRSVWFTPTVEESDAGADWFRCDVIAVATDERLAPLRGRIAGVLDRPQDRGRYAMCSTAPPGDDDFQRVICSRAHTWRAVQVVRFEAGTYPGVGQVRGAGATPCKEAGRVAAEDGLAFRWGYEWPTRAQWDSGQTYGFCWVPNG